MQHILTISAISLPPKTKKLVLTLTTAILTHIWETRNWLQFDGTIIPTTNIIVNIKNDLKNIIQSHYKQHNINNTLDEFKTNFCINNTLCTLTNESLTLIRLGFLRLVFPGRWGRAGRRVKLNPLSYFKKNLSNINITLYSC